jgi:hypothetical protein
MMAQGNPFLRRDAHWSWPIDLTAYDRSPGLTEAERQELAQVAARSGGPGNSGGQPKHSSQVLHRLLTPLEDICQKIRENYTDGTNQNRRASTIRAFVLEMNRRQTPFWAWSEREWTEFIAPSWKSLMPVWDGRGDAIPSQKRERERVYS